MFFVFLDINIAQRLHYLCLMSDLTPAANERASLLPNDQSEASVVSGQMPLSGQFLCPLIFSVPSPLSLFGPLRNSSN